MAGRRPDPALDVAIRREAFDLLVESGWSGFTVEGVAGRAGIPKSTIYKRWSSRVHLAVAVLEEWFASVTRTVPDDDQSGDRERLTQLVRLQLALTSTSEGRAIVQLMLADGDIEPVRPLWLRASEHRAACRAVLADIVDRRGADVDVDVLMDMLLGGVGLQMMRGKPAQPQDTDRIVDGVLALLGPNRPAQAH